MRTVYLLLRNNKQEGPFTLEELLLRTLKPHDLVWIEGQTGWRYPSEIEELKPYLQPLDGIKNVVIEKSTDKSKGASAGLKKKVFVSMPFSNPENEGASTKKEAFEKKAEALYQRSQAFAAEKKPGANEEIEIKYSRSLDDIKQEYAQWLEAQKTSKRRLRKMKPLLFPAFILATIGIAAILVAFRNEQPIEQAAISPIDQISKAPDYKVSLSASKNKKTALQNKKWARFSKAKKKAINASLAKTTKQRNPVIKSREDKGTKNSGDASQPLAKQVSISGTFHPDDPNGISNFRITVKNNSAQSLRFVAVDVIYLASNGTPSSKKTIYFKHLSPHGSITLNAPSNQKANDVRLQLGLLSSEDGEVYYAMN
jgi:hypothetical protein